MIFAISIIATTTAAHLFIAFPAHTKRATTCIRTHSANLTYDRPHRPRKTNYFIKPIHIPTSFCSQASFRLAALKARCMFALPPATTQTRLMYDSRGAYVRVPVRSRSAGVCQCVGVHRHTSTRACVQAHSWQRTMTARRFDSQLNAGSDVHYTPTDVIFVKYLTVLFIYDKDNSDVTRCVCVCVLS